MHIGRLNRLIEVLENVASKGRGFDMGVWCHKTPCSTTACAVGWGAMDPVLRAQGLGLVKFKGVLHRRYEPTYRGNASIWAVMAFFGLTWGEAERLFTPGTYPTGVSPDMVADRIRALIATHQATHGNQTPAEVP